MNKKPPLHSVKLTAGCISQVFRVLSGYFQEDLFCLLPVTLKRNKNRYFIPDILEPRTVIRQRLCKDLAVGYMYNSPGGLVRVNPIPHLYKGKLKHSYINNI